MASVCEEIACPICGYAFAYYEVRVNCGSEWIICSRCGYNSTSVRNYDTMEFDKEELGGIGCFSIWFDGAGQFGPIKDENQRKEMIEQARVDIIDGKMVNGKGERASSVTHTFFKNDEWWKEDLITGLTHSFCDECPFKDEQTCPCEVVEEEWNDGREENE